MLVVERVITRSQVALGNDNYFLWQVIPTPYPSLAYALGKIYDVSKKIPGKGRA